MQKNPTTQQKQYTSANTPVIPKNVDPGKLLQNEDVHKSDIWTNEPTHPDSWKQNLSRFETQMLWQKAEPNQSSKTVASENSGKSDLNICKSTTKDNVDSCTKSEASKEADQIIIANNKPVLTDTIYKQHQQDKTSQSNSSQLPKQNKSQKTKPGEVTSVKRPTKLHQKEASAGGQTTMTKTNQKQKPAGTRVTNVPARVTEQKTLSNMLHVEFMGETPFAGDGVLRLTSDNADYAASGFADELKGILNERLMTSRMCNNMKKFLSRIGARKQGTETSSHPNGAQLYEAEMQKLGQCSDEEVNERLERIDAFSQKSKLSIDAFDEHQKSQQVMFNAEGAAFVDVCVHTGLVSMIYCLT